jgi:hypothetical protein
MVGEGEWTKFHFNSKIYDRRPRKDGKSSQPTKERVSESSVLVRNFFKQYNLSFEEIPKDDL